MKRIGRFLFAMCITAVAAVTMAVNCEPDQPDPPDPPEPPAIIDTKYDIGADGASLTLSLEAADAWTAYVEGGGKWCEIDNTAGSAGTATIVVSIYPNMTPEPRSCTVHLKVGNAKGKVVINQAQRDMLKAEPSAFEFEAQGGTATAVITSNVEYEVTVSDDWVVWDNGTIVAAENTAEEERTATITLAGGGLTCTITVKQAPAEVVVDPYDGLVTVLQTHTEGAGIPIVLMGDAFETARIEDGSYAGLMEHATELFFSVEPYTTFRNMFDVYMVNVVSPFYEDFESGTSTTLGSYFTAGTYVGADLDKCEEYARKAISEEQLDRSLVIVLLNREYHAGRCYLSFKYEEGNPACSYEQGIAFALAALGTDEEDFTGLIQHEAGGHGFGKLADEYFYPGTGAVPEAMVEQYSSLQARNRAYLNVDFTPDAESVNWNRFITDERYAFDGIGVFEGGCEYETGIWRPTESSIMRDNTGGFNAPSRELIYYRLHCLAYGSEWEYDFEDFAAYDVVNRKSDPEIEPDPNPEPEPACRRKSRSLVPCPPPVIISR